MVGQSTVTKPSRSDEVLDEEQQLRIANQIRAQFDSLAPKRTLKPNRSEPDHTTPTGTPSDSSSTTDYHFIPELDKLLSLQAEPHEKLSVEGVAVVQDEFKETQYYKELDAIDKQHHKTGSGFIDAAREEGQSQTVYEIQLQSNHVHGGQTTFAGLKSNPATNDWIPNIDDNLGYVSSKPNRSESS